MQWPVAGAVLVGLLVVLSGIPGPAGAISSPVVGATDSAADDPDSQRAMLCEGGPPDPPADDIGWEAGCWYNQSISVDQSDGLNVSERNATIALTMARVEHVRQLEFERTVPVEIMSRDEYRESQVNNTVGPPLTTFDNAKFKSLFLIGDDEDSIAIQNENAGVGVLGFYSPSREAIVLVSENASVLEVDELTLAHELMHALQDQHFNLSRYNARTRDNANAQSGLIEGDAKFVEHQYRSHCEAGEDGPWNGTCLSPSDTRQGTSGELANIGAYLMKFQPYSDGPAFILSLYREEGWETVNAAYEHPPTSSEQVIHPEKYGIDEPTAIDLEDTHRGTWERVRPPNRPAYGSVGEAALFMMFWYPGYHSGRQTEVIPYASFVNVSGTQISQFQPYMYEHRYSAGWDGDRLHVYRNARNETAYVWRLAWDTPADAREFIAGYQRVLKYWGAERTGVNRWVIEDGGFGGAYRITVGGGSETVTIVHGPTEAALAEVREDVGETPSPTIGPWSPIPVTDTSPASRSPVGGILGTDGQPGFGALTAMAVAVVAGFLWWRRK